ncbi:cob(I)yrinic acid a,c-diamide adenosyltransferase [Mycobacterium sp. ITM-2016-00317]|uniref:cob(I)yrinic acid a,c-diamide adenosyltransferase n=1 Tax=Mycobacterium sp. ITM-2016-00317 TaxID=2099694 RepID=UPI000D40F23B|nr:cob(I)yrinic acid a,c-diamide adenosyltransferase [Mycobacterium sp. ITM-2016-00317]WNG88768.1 cob(I)yrinic acid a,c-diamide adenosyltransferase [Mycobacterium sp. ITM-2016-00317]
MAVHLTRIYTRTGDAGTTALGDMSRVAKSDVRVGAYADCDETNALLGVALACGGLSQQVASVIGVIQNDLFDVGADLCTPIVAEPEYEPLRVTEEQVTQLESWCDEFNADLPKLSSFILPGGTAAAASLHHARTVARRAERSAWFLAEQATVNDRALRYLNRLSDLLFILARYENPDGDVLWRPGGDRTAGS